MRRLVITSIFIFLGINPSYCKINSIPMTVVWGTGTIRFEHPSQLVHHGVAGLNSGETVDGAILKRQPVMCELGSITREALVTKCLTVNVNTAKSVDGYFLSNLRYLKSIALLPPTDVVNTETDENVKLTKESEARKFPSLYKVENNIVKMRRLDDFELQFILNTHVNLDKNGSNTYRFGPVTDVANGEYVLETWKMLAGMKPTRDCLERDDYCSVVTKALVNGRDALAYCAVMNSQDGLGLPFNCAAVAYEDGGRWYVFSADGPAADQDCKDGCGETSDEECTIPSPGSLTLEQVATAVTRAFKEAKTNIKLNVYKKNDNLIIIKGRNVKSDSQFFVGYYDLSEAIYKIRREPTDDTSAGGIITVDGIFNLVISAEPSDKSNDYRNFSSGKEDSAFIWFQKQILRILQDKVTEILDVPLECHVEDFEKL